MLKTRLPCHPRRPPPSAHTRIGAAAAADLSPKRCPAGGVGLGHEAVAGGVKRQHPGVGEARLRQQLHVVRTDVQAQRQARVVCGVSQASRWEADKRKRGGGVTIACGAVRKLEKGEKGGGGHRAAFLVARSTPTLCTRHTEAVDDGPPELSNVVIRHCKDGCRGHKTR